MTVKQGLRRIIIKKTLVLIVIAIALVAMCYYASSHKNIPDYDNAHIMYTLVSIGISLLIFFFTAWKMRYFHDIFTREFKGTIVSVKRERINSFRANMNMDDLVLLIQPDTGKRKIKMRLPYQKVGRVYLEGDRVHRLRGTRYPINLTREVEQHICPICGFNSCYGDECPNCRVKY